MDRHRLDTDPDPKPNFHSDADPDWHKNDADPHADPIPSFILLENLKFCFTFSHNTARLQWFIILFSVNGVLIFSILNSILKFSGEKAYQLYHVLEIDTDPDPAK